MTVQTLRPNRSIDCSDAEWDQRVNLAAALQLAEHFGWTMLVWNHISARVPGTADHFLMNAQGLLYDEATASGVAKVDVDGNEFGGDSDVAEAGFVIHGAVYQARPDVACVVHTHTPESVAVSCLDEGLPQLSGETGFFHDDIAYYDYQGVSLDLDERAQIAACLGEKNFMVMKNHGLTTVGRTIPEAFLRMYWLVYCCRIVTHLYGMGKPYRPLAPALADRVAQQDCEVAAPGAHEWPALLRRLDRIAPIYKT